MASEHFSVLILIGRPGSGKSEIVDYLEKLPHEERAGRFRIAEMDVLDDFPLLWTWFEEDFILSERLGQPRLHSDDQRYFKYPYLWDVLIERLGLEYHKRLIKKPAYHESTTTMVEFSRGSEHGGYRQAFQHLPDDLLKLAGIMYLNVSFQESLRKNRVRYDPEQPGSILGHSLPDAKMKRLYWEDDWAELTASDGSYLQVGSVRIPYVVFDNEDDVTSGKPEQLATRLEMGLSRLWILNRSR